MLFLNYLGRRRAAVRIVLPLILALLLLVPILNMFPPGVPPVCAIDGTLLEPKLGAFARAFPNEKDDAAGAGLLDGAAAPN